MRLGVVERGHRLPQKILMGIIRVLSRRRVVDIIRTLLYRPEFFGRPISAWTQEAFAHSAKVLLRRGYL